MVKSLTPALDLRLDWASYDAAKFACMHWHYSKCLPVGKLVKIGVWEYDKYIGCVLFGRGANHNMLTSFGLDQDQGCELVRIALKKHQAAVTRILKFALLFLKKQSPKLKLIVSYADPDEGHHGGIYQGGNWIYAGISGTAVKIYYKGKWAHKKTVDDAGINQAHLPKKKVQGKHKYLMPLDAAMRSKILPLSQPYPKRAKGQDARYPPALGGSTPTCALQTV